MYDKEIIKNNRSMTREEEREKAAYSRYCNDSSVTFGLQCNCFKEGAEWGVDELCSYLREIKYQEFPGGTFETLLSEEQIEDLRREVLYC